MSARPQINLTPPEDLPSTLAAEGDPMPGVCARRLLTVVALLVVFGLTMLYSTSYNVVGTKHFKFQLIWVVLGTCAAFGVYFVGYRRIAAGRWFWVGIVAVMLVAARLFFPPINGAYRWIKVPIPGFPFSIQPSEFAKLAVALFAARYCSDNLRTFSDLRRWRGGIVELGAVVGPMLGLILLGHDLGTTLLVALTAWAILTAAGLRWWYQVIPLAGLSLGSVYIFFCDSMRLGRVLSFLDPERYAQDIGYQLWNSLLALGSGSWFGIGFMESRIKQLYLPESHTDFILAIVGEELGLTAMLLVVLAYAFWAWNALKISLSANFRLGMLLGFGLTVMVSCQALINMAVISGSIPTKGMPAPFISYGGSNMIVSMMTVGLLISIAEETVNPGYSDRYTAWIRGVAARFRRHGERPRTTKQQE